MNRNNPVLLITFMLAAIVAGGAPLALFVYLIESIQSAELSVVAYVICAFMGLVVSMALVLSLLIVWYCFSRLVHLLVEIITA